ncbi:hypothetical protein A2U01_0010465 [Trifolium medium]|uniref:Uncharacterized protein n=1 Tax=Trifolium medium TaxID=97028 RepID=A0A392MR43_9FABA|nr:hypothetical protein [Trifolium medium]
MQKAGSISDMGTWDSNRWSWKLEWTDVLTITEAEASCDLLLLFEQNRIELAEIEPLRRTL